MSISNPSAKIISALFCLCVVLPFQVAPAHAQKAAVRYEEKKRQTNDIAVSIVVSGLSCTCARFAEDMRNVVNDLREDGLRVLPVLGVGGLQNLNDVLFLKNIDMGIVDEDNLAVLKRRDPQLYAGIEQSVQYLTKLYNSEFHVLARNEIKSYEDLRGKKVNFNLKDSQTEVSAQVIFEMLKIDVQRSNYDNDEAIKRLRSGELSAMIILTGAPQAALAKLRKEDGVHFLQFEEQSLPNHDMRPVLARYNPAELTHAQYPALIPEGTSVATLGNRALLVTYAWPERSVRYNRIAKFVREFFGKIDQFQAGAKNGSRHPKWEEVNLWAEVPGWQRFKPAAEWLSEHRTMSMKGQFDQFVQSRSEKAISERDKEELFVQFQQYLRSQASAPTRQR
jgi:TRAP-type uncharacterized transport system substrate-binding protein